MIATNNPKTEPIQYKKILAGSVGNLIEWFDWTIYAAFAIFSAVNFSHPGMIRQHFWQLLLSLPLASLCAPWEGGSSDSFRIVLAVEMPSH